MSETNDTPLPPMVRMACDLGRVKVRAIQGFPGQVPDDDIAWDDDTDWLLGLCPECGAIKDFKTERARDLWERNHTHDAEVGAE